MPLSKPLMSLPGAGVYPEKGGSSSYDVDWIPLYLIFAPYEEELRVDPIKVVTDSGNKQIVISAFLLKFKIGNGMQFNSFQFLIFFLTVYIFYCFSNLNKQNSILLIASYFFYATWDYRFLALISFSTVFNYWTGIHIKKNNSERSSKNWLTLNITINLFLLGYFKYFNFFIDSFSRILEILGLDYHVVNLPILLPVGISFFTFQAIGYSVDIYRKKNNSSGSFLEFAIYLSFFPKLVAGPIERASQLLPQISAPRKIDAALFKTSIFLLFYGVFEKVFVADNLAVFVDQIYNIKGSDGLSVLLATYGYAFQIFADFDGYSNMAKGIAGIMGFHLVSNFNAPYFSQSPKEFWSRWHISLSSWLRDYLYIPLGGNRLGRFKTVRNVIVSSF